MDLLRTAYRELLHWKKESAGKTALLIDGARRIGKSYLAQKFGKAEYKSCLYIDFTRPFPGAVETLTQDAYDLNLLFSKLSVLSGVALFPRESLIVFDEIQLCPPARQLIKHLVADGRFDYLETGSLLSMKRNIQGIVLPSEEEHLDLAPLDFREFLTAMGEGMIYEVLRQAFEARRPLGRTLHQKAMGLFREYLLVGGMPQALLAYLGEEKKRDFAAADREKRGILRLYRDDMARYATGYETKVEAIFDQIPEQLSRKEKLYRLASLGKASRMRNYEDAFIWLDDARIVNPCLNATDPTVGLSLSRDHTTQKLYMADTGLLVTETFRDEKFSDNSLYRDILLDRLGVNEGMLMENAAAQAFRTAGKRLFFYSRSDSENRANNLEIDFLIKHDGKISPVEVKSSTYRKHSSLDKFRTKFRDKIGESFLLYNKDVMVRDGVIHLPLYMAMFL